MKKINILLLGMLLTAILVLIDMHLSSVGHGCGTPESPVQKVQETTFQINLLLI